MKRCSISLIIRATEKWKSKPQGSIFSHSLERYYQKKINTSVGEDGEKLEPYCTVCEIVKWNSSVAQLCLTLCDPMNHSTPGLPVHHQLLEFTQTHVHWVSEAIQPYNPLSSPSPPIFNLSQHQGLFQWVSSSHQVAKVLEFQLQHQSFQWIFKTDFL